jgi:hypothetical protein
LPHSFDASLTVQGVAGVQLDPLEWQLEIGLVIVHLLHNHKPANEVEQNLNESTMHPRPNAIPSILLPPNVSCGMIQKLAVTFTGTKRLR